MQLSLDPAMERTFTVAELGQLVHDLIAETFPHDLWVQGEIRDLKRHGTGHVFFKLVDPTPSGRSPDAALAVILFDSKRREINAQIRRAGGGMRMDDGVAVRVRAVPELYVPSGQFNLRMTGIDPAYTLGQLAASRERLLRMLADEELLDRNGALAFPAVPLRVGLVTARGSAAEADFVAELARTELAFLIRVAPTPVQGAGASHRIAASIRACVRAGVDVIAVVRGGGARTDLAAFDDEVVARTIAGCPVPVLTGIGHEIDTSVADRVAHLSLKTPTACAAHLAEAVLASDRTAARCWRSIATLAASRLEAQDRRLAAAAETARATATQVLRDADRTITGGAHRARALVGARLDRAGQRLARHLAAATLSSRHRLSGAGAHLDRAAARLERNARERLRQATRRVDEAHTQVRLLDPSRALARGWSITMTEAGDVIRSVADAPGGTALVTRVADGRIASTVDQRGEP